MIRGILSGDKIHSYVLEWWMNVRFAVLPEKAPFPMLSIAVTLPLLHSA